MATFEPGDLVTIRSGTKHCPIQHLDFNAGIIRRTGRPATVTRTMAGGQIVIVEAAEHGIRPAATLRVPIGDLEHRSA